MSLESQYVIGLYRDVNPTKKRCRHNIGCPLSIFPKWVKFPKETSGVLDERGVWLYNNKVSLELRIRD